MREQNLINTAVTGLCNFLQMFCNNTEEEKCFQRNIRKSWLSCSLGEDKQVERRSNMSHHGPLYGSKNANVRRGWAALPITITAFWSLQSPSLYPRELSEQQDRVPEDGKPIINALITKPPRFLNSGRIWRQHNSRVLRKQMCGINVEGCKENIRICCQDIPLGKLT